jgi:CHAP domain
MSIESTLARVGVIRQAIADPSSLIASRSAITGGTEAPSSAAPAAANGSFAAALSQASTGTGAAPGSVAATIANASSVMLAGRGAGSGVLGAGSSYPYALGGLQGSATQMGLGPGGTGNSRLVTAAESQLGQSEQPPGSNESPAIAEYRSATAGAMPGEPWCAYFASWAARQAGTPLGAGGEGLGSVSGIWSWAQGAGRAVPNGPGVLPRPGDLIVFGSEHVGIVRGVTASGQIATIEGNYQNQVSANVRNASEATGYVSMS